MTGTIDLSAHQLGTIYRETQGTGRTHLVTRVVIHPHANQAVRVEEYSLNEGYEGPLVRSYGVSRDGRAWLLRDDPTAPRAGGIPGDGWSPGRTPSISD